MFRNDYNLGRQIIRVATIIPCERSGNRILELEEVTILVGVVIVTVVRGDARTHFAREIAPCKLIAAALRITDFPATVGHCVGARACGGCEQE